MNKNKRNFIIIFLLTAVVLYFALKDDFTTKIKYLMSFDPKWLLCGLILVIVYWFLKGLVLYYLINKLDKNYTIKQGLHMIVNTQFFNAITPFSSGGQPYQIYRLKKDGLSLGKSTNVIIQDFIVYQIALVLLGIIAVASNYIFHIFPNNSILKNLVTIGFIINTLVIIILFVVAFSEKWNKKIINTVIKLLDKLKLIKAKDKLLEKSSIFIKNFHAGAQMLMEDKLNFIKTIFLNFVALIILYLVPFMLLKGLNIYVNPLIVIVSSAYVMLIGSMVPIPGGTGGLEYSFTAFFGNFIKGTKLSIVMIVWRLVTYYFGLIVGAFTLNFHKEDKK